MPEQSTDQNKMVKRSHARCALSESFFDDFYNTFMGADPEIRPMFANTDMEKQKALLKNGITYLIMFDRGNIIGTTALRDIGKIHSRSEKNVQFKFYPIWVDSLLKTVAKHDPKFNNELEAAWRSVLTKGIEFLKSKY